MDRADCGISYEPCNWMVAGEDYVFRVTFKRLDPLFFFNVYVQRHRLNLQGEGAIRTWQTEARSAGPHRISGNQEDFDFDDVFQGLQEVAGWSYVAVHKAGGGIMSVADAARRSAGFLAILDGLSGALKLWGCQRRSWGLVAGRAIWEVLVQGSLKRD